MNFLHKTINKIYFFIKNIHIYTKYALKIVFYLNIIQ